MTTLRGGVVAVAGTGDELAAAARGNHIHVDGAEGAVAIGVRGIVGQNVLIADVVRDLFADVVHVIDIFREEGQAAGGRGDLLERLASALGFLPVYLTEEADGVDHRIGLLDFANHFLQGIAAGVVFAVGNDEEDLLVLGSFFKMVKRADDRVAQSGAAAGIDAFEGFFQLGNAAGEILVEIEIEVVVEVDDESFVLGVAGLHESDGRFVDAGTLVAHAAAIIDHQPHADGNVLALEDGKFLFDFVFEDAKIFRLEAVGEALTVIDDRRVQHQQVNVNLDAGALLTGVGILAGRRRRRIGDGNLSEGRRSEQNGSADQETQIAQGWKETPEELSGWGRSSRSWNRR